MKSEWQHKVTLRKSLKCECGKPSTFTVVAGLHCIRGNKAPYFSVTGTIEHTDKRETDPFCVGGCMHETVLKHFPELAPVVALHLSDDKGEPMHARANGLYRLGLTEFPSGKSIELAAKHFRCCEGTIKLLLNGLSLGTDSYSEFIFNCRKRWAIEAEKAIETLKSLQD